MKTIGIRYNERFTSLKNHYKLQLQHQRCGLISDFFLSHLGAGNGDVSVVIVDPQGKKDTVELILENKGDSVFRCTYRPMLEGPHTIHVLFAGQEIPKSPFTVNIAEGKSSVCVLNYCQTNPISRCAVSVMASYPSQSTVIFIFPGNGCPI